MPTGCYQRQALDALWSLGKAIRVPGFCGYKYTDAVLQGRGRHGELFKDRALGEAWAPLPGAGPIRRGRGCLLPPTQHSTLKELACLARCTRTQVEAQTQGLTAALDAHGQGPLQAALLSRTGHRTDPLRGPGFRMPKGLTHALPASCLPLSKSLSLELLRTIKGMQGA